MSEPRAKNYEVENELLKPGAEGEAPRPATEPDGAADSVRTPKTETDPGSGEQA